MNESICYNIYNNMLNEYKNVDINKDCSYEGNLTFSFLAEALAKLNFQNPIEDGQPGCNEYNDMIYFYDIWPKDKTNCAFKKRFLYAAYQLCTQCPENIFPEPEAEKEVKEEESENTDEDQEKSIDIDKKQTKLIKQNYVFGVVQQKGSKK